MEEFWDRRARENAAYFVDNRLHYRRPEMEAFWQGGREALNRMLGSLGATIGPGDEVVEIGCGVGRLTRWLAQRAATVRALDVSEEMLVRAAELNDLPNVTWVHGDGTSLAGIESASADVCFSDVVFQHIPDPAITLGYVEEMGRVLRPGGWAAFQVSNDPSIHRRRPPWERLRTTALARIGRAPRGQAHPAWLGSAIDLEELRRTCAGAGLTAGNVLGAGTQHCHVLLLREPR
jgi:SAM-dependent methyltransferase